MVNESVEKTTLHCESSTVGCHRYISWSTIIVSALVAVGLSFLVYIFTTGLGLTAFTRNTTGQLTLMVGGFVWLIVAFYVVMFVVGYIAGILVRPHQHRCLGVLHGFAAWCLALIITAAVFSPILTGTFGAPTYYGLNSPMSSSQIRANTNPNTVTNPTTVNKLGIGVLGIFFVFFAGALGSCTGGYVGCKPKVLPVK